MHGISTLNFHFVTIEPAVSAMLNFHSVSKKKLLFNVKKQTTELFFLLSFLDGWSIKRHKVVCNSMKMLDFQLEIFTLLQLNKNQRYQQFTMLNSHFEFSLCFKNAFLNNNAFNWTLKDVVIWTNMLFCQYFSLCFKEDALLNNDAFDNDFFKSTFQSMIFLIEFFNQSMIFFWQFSTTKLFL